MTRASPARPDGRDSRGAAAVEAGAFSGRGADCARRPIPRRSASEREAEAEPMRARDGFGDGAALRRGEAGRFGPAAGCAADRAAVRAGCAERRGTAFALDAAGRRGAAAREGAWPARAGS